MTKPRSLLLLLASAVFAQSVPNPPKDFTGKSWWAHVKVLAADNMDGRETGSPGLKRAEAYVVDQLKQAGIEPAGEDGYYQPVKFVSRAIDEKDSSMALVKDGKVEPLTLGEDAFFSTRPKLAPEVEAPLVFVGYGLKIPEQNYDDLAGLDLKGKIAVVFSGIPASIPGPLGSHYSSGAERWKALREAGAIGSMGIPNPGSMDIPWSRMALSRTRPSMELAGREFDDTAGEQIGGVFNPADADKLFANSGHTFQEILALSKERKQLPRFPLNISLRAHAKTVEHDVESANVIGKLPGSDSSLKDQYVVLSAHIDHLGIGQPINGDRIYNGAMDNAAGDSVLLDVASALHGANEKPKRSLLFVFVTGEEKGELGSRYFVARPTVPEKSIVADINIDMFLPLYPMKRAIVYGVDESDLGDNIRQIAKKDGIEVQEDPEPQRNSFIRSDQYSFIKKGIPALTMKVGYVPGSADDKTFHNWLHQRYHAPSDDLNQPVDIGAAGKYEQVISQLLLSVADDQQRPEWKQNSFFRRYAQESSGQ
ncbi:MAG TPA: M28 family metallopeptidase [Terriglobales bacterium]|nr:M28 family metallopeptidase [Terriglobales bacterium]